MRAIVKDASPRGPQASESAERERVLVGEGGALDPESKSCLANERWLTLIMASSSLQ